MSETVRTSITDRPSSDWVDDLSNERKWKRLDDLPIVLDENSTVVRRERGHDILPFQFPADEVFGAVELDATMGVHLADKRDAALGDGKSQVTAGIDVMIEREAVREMVEGRPEPIAKNAGEPGPMIGQGEASTGLLEVVVSKEALARPAQSPKIGAGVNKDAFLPEAIEAFRGGVPSGFSLGDEEKMDPQQEMEPDELGETITIPSPARRGHLVIHLGNAGKAHNSPGINQMTPKRDRSFVPELAGCCGLSGDVDGMDGIEPGDSLGAAKMTGSDQIGLLKITHLMGRDIGIGRTVGRAFGPDLFCSPGAGQDLLDGRDGGKSTEAPSLKLEMDRFGAEARKSGATGLVGRQFIAQGQNFSDQRRRRLVGNPFRRSALVLKPIESKFPIATEPFGHPEAAPMNGPDDFHKSHPVLVKFNGFLSSLVFALDAHRKNLLPVDMGKSLCDEQIAYRCPYGFSLSDVLTETR